MPLTLEQFGQSIKAKHPEYTDLPDTVLGHKILQKYPQYKDMIGVTEQPPLPGKVQQLNAITEPYMKAGAGVMTALTSPVKEAIRPFATLRDKSIPSPWGDVKPLNFKPGGETAGGALAGAADLVLGALPAVKAEATVLKKPLTLAAEKLYQSALKPGEKAIAQGVVKTGLRERVWLTSGGVEKVANKIEDWENLLGKQIEAGKAAGVKIKTAGMKMYLDEAKKFFADHFDPQVAKNSVHEINAIGKRFLKKYGKEMPIEEAQKVKVSTGQALRKYYGELSGAAQEASKQGVRFLKEKIVEQAPKVGDINARLKSLYELDQALGKAGRRIGNLNLLGLGAKFGAAAAGKTGAAVGILADLADKPWAKSGVAIGLNELGNLGAKGQIPLTTLFKFLAQKIQENQSGSRQ